MVRFLDLLRRRCDGDCRRSVGAIEEIGPVFAFIKRLFSIPMNATAFLKGDGTWPFIAEIDGDDIVVRDVKATCFGGDSDPQDNGETASGISTRRNPRLQACALPLSYSRMEALRGSPIPWMPWRTPVDVTHGDVTITVPLIDLGPGKQATRKGQPAHAIDLTVAAARRFMPEASATNFSLHPVTYRIRGGARFAPPTLAA